MKTVRVSVTKRDIKSGRRWLMDGCPVALAIRRATGEYVYVVEDHCMLGGKEPHLPVSAQRFIARFDADKAVRPFSFTLRVPKARRT